MQEYSRTLILSRKKKKKKNQTKSEALQKTMITFITYHSSKSSADLRNTICCAQQFSSLIFLAQKKPKYSAVPGKTLLLISSIYSKTLSNNTLTKDSYSESAIHKASTGKTPIFFLRANNSLRFSIRIFSLFHTSITSASLIPPYYNSVSIFFLLFFFFFTKLIFKIFHYSITVFTFNVQKCPIFSSFRELPLFRKIHKKVITSADIFADQYHRFSEL